MKAVVFRRSGWSLGGLDKGCGLEMVWMVCRRCGWSSEGLDEGCGVEKVWMKAVVLRRSG